MRFSHGEVRSLPWLCGVGFKAELSWMHFPRHNRTTCLLPQRRSEARQISKPGFAFLGLGAEGWPNRHLLFCAKSPMQQARHHPNCTKEILHLERVTGVWASVREVSGTRKLYSDWRNSVNKLWKFCHCWQAVMLFIQFNRAISHLKRVWFSNS